MSTPSSWYAVHQPSSLVLIQLERGFWKIVSTWFRGTYQTHRRQEARPHQAPIARSPPVASRSQCVQFKPCLLTYKALHGLAPSYIADLRRPVTSVSSRDRLRSATCGDLVVSSSVTHFGTCAFVAVGPKAWKKLPMHIWAWETVSTFKTALKPHFHFVD